MTERDASRFAKVMAILGETFNDTVSDARAEAYFQALADFDIGEVEQAAQNHVRVGRFFPKPVELREWITGTEDEQAEDAWHALVREVRQTGHTGRPMLPALTLDAIERVWGSWVALCEALPADGPGYSKWETRFRETYRVLAARELTALLEAPTRRLLSD